MTWRLSLSVVAFSMWLYVASTYLPWVWPLATGISVAAGWWLAKGLMQSDRAAYAKCFGLPVIVALSLVAVALVTPDQTFGTIVGKMAVLHLVSGLAAFAFVRHILQPAGAV